MGGRELGVLAFSQTWYYTERWERASIQTCPNLFLKILTKGGVSMEAGSLFQYLTTLTKAHPFLVRQLLSWRTLCVCTLREGRVGGNARNFGSTSSRPVNTLNVVTRWDQTRRSCRECRLSRYKPLLVQGITKVTSLVANFWIRSRWLIYATRFNKQP